MSYWIGHGANAYTFSESILTTATSADNVVVASGPCVLDGLLANEGSDGVAILFAFKDADGNALHTWPIDTTGAALIRDGVNVGPLGMRSRNGLVVDVTNNDAGTSQVNMTFLYRKLA